MNKIIKLTIILFLLFVTYVAIEMSSISTKYINKSIISFDISNVKNPKIKSLTRSLDDFYAQFLFKVSKKHQKHLDQTDEKFVSLPETKIIYAKKKNFTISNSKDKNTTNNWHRSNGNHSSNRFSDLTQINLNNINKLDLVWKYKFDEIKRDIQANPIVAENKIFLPTTGNKIIALNPENGKKIWERKINGMPARRGLVYWNSNNNESRLFFCAKSQLISINSKNGNFIKDFGNRGTVKLKKECKVAPVIINDNLVIATFEPAVEVYNLFSGKLLWKYYLKEKKYNEKRYGGKRYDYSGGNPWGGISADVNRGIVFITTGNAGFYFNGVNRPGKNKYSNSIIAIDVINKKKLWDFQEVAHDIWNLDIPAPPILTSINKNNKKIDVVVAVTKLGNTIILDRLSGDPIFDFHKKKAPRSKIPGEKTAYYQPNLKLPEPFSKQFFTLNEITDISKESRDYISNKIKNSHFGFFQPHEMNKTNIIFGFNGGAEWMGGSVNSNTGIMFITSNNIAWEATIGIKPEKNGYYKYGSVTKRLLDQNGYPGSKPPWGLLTAIDLNFGKIIWQVPLGYYEELKNEGKITGTENFGGATGTAGDLVFVGGTMDKQFRAFNSKNGEEVWSYELPYTASGPASIYSIDGTQYVVVAATGNTALSFGYPESIKFGNWLYCFKLKE